MRTRHKFIRAISPLIPEGVRSWLRTRVSLGDYDLARRRDENELHNLREASYPASRYRLGVIEDPAQYHQHYVAACRELSVSYTVLDLLADDWIERFRRSGCDAFLAWPSCASTMFKEAFDYRLWMLESELGRVVYPTWKECWLTEHKPRLRDWFDAHGLPHARTWVFHDREQALNFARTAALPIVSKTAMGASASGIRVIHTRRELVAVIREAFRRGLCPRGFDPYDRQWGFVYLQEYLPGVDEWRMVRVGDSFFGYRKERGPSGLHSASHNWSWLDPEPALLDLTARVTDEGGFTSMDVDILRTPDGGLYVSECQTVFGCTTPAIQMKVNDVEGRYLRTKQGWRFEAGSFCQNHMCNLRVDFLRKRLDERGR